MTGKKLPLEYITGDSQRKAAFNRRKKGLVRKVSELSTLCGINACAVIYSSFNSQPEIWPPSPVIVHRLLTKFKEIPHERNKKKVSHEGYIMERITKVSFEGEKLRKDTKWKELTNTMNQCLSRKIPLATLSQADLHDLGEVIDYNVKVISKRIENLNKSTGQQAVVESPPRPQLQVEPLPVDESQLHHHPTDPWMAPQLDEDDSFVAGEMINPYGDGNINIRNGVWANSFYH